jgi:hypothetical protein
LSSSRGVRLIPRRLAPHAVGREGVYPFKRYGIIPFEFSKTTQHTSALPPCQAWEVCLLCPGAGAAQSRAAPLNAAWS